MSCGVSAASSAHFRGLAAEHAGDDLQLLADLGRAGLGEDAAEGGGDHLGGPGDSGASGDGRAAGHRCRR
jgi:hypothetical protein